MTQAKKGVKSYQSMNDELQAIVMQMQREDLDIDEALLHYERGLRIVEELSSYLKTAENKIIELQTKLSKQ